MALKAKISICSILAAFAVVSTIVVPVEFLPRANAQLVDSCTVAQDGNDALLTFSIPDGKTSVVRRDGSFLTTLDVGATSYRDTGADLEAHSWLIRYQDAGSPVDVPCDIDPGGGDGGGEDGEAGGPAFSRIRQATAAPDCRVVYPGAKGRDVAETSDGAQLFSNTMAWLLGDECGPDVATPASPALSATLCHVEASRETPQALPQNDPDKDGLSNDDEIAIGTDPDTADTDLDGVNDGLEVELGSDPLDSSSSPGADQLDSTLWVRDFEVADVDYDGDGTAERVVYIAGRFTKAWDATATEAEAEGALGVVACDLDTGEVIDTFDPPIHIDPFADTLISTRPADGSGYQFFDSVTVEQVAADGTVELETFTDSWQNLRVPVDGDGDGTFDVTDAKERVRTVLFHNGSLYIGGKFRLQANEISVPTPVPINWDYPQLDGAIDALTFSTDLDLANGIDGVNGTPTPDGLSDNYVNLIKVDPITGAIDTSWTPSLRGSVATLDVHEASGSLFVGGGVHTSTSGLKSKERVLVDHDNDPATGDIWIVRNVGADIDFRTFTGLARLDLATGEVAASSGVELRTLINEADNAVRVLDGKAPKTIGEEVVGGALVQSLAIDDATDTLYVAGAFDEAVNGAGVAVTRDASAAFDIADPAAPALTGFAPNLADRNYPYDVRAQIKDVVLTARGVLLCGDWWQTEGEGEASLAQPRPNQHNFGLFAPDTGDPVRTAAGEVWGAVTDGGVQACDYDPVHDVFIVGGHYDYVGPYDSEFAALLDDPDYVAADQQRTSALDAHLAAITNDGDVDGTRASWRSSVEAMQQVYRRIAVQAGAALGENDEVYPPGHRRLSKVTAIAGDTGSIIDEWVPDVGSIRGLDAVELIDGEFVLIGGANFRSEGLPYPSVASYGWRTPVTAAGSNLMIVTKPSATPLSTDADMQAALQADGYTVTIHEASRSADLDSFGNRIHSLTQTDLEGVDAIILSPEVSSSDVPSWMKNVSLPVLVAKPSLALSMGLVPGDPDPDDPASNTVTPLQNRVAELTITDDDGAVDHPVLAGLTENIQVFPADNDARVVRGWTSQTWQQTAPADAVVLAVTPPSADPNADTRGAALVAYATGASLDDQIFLDGEPADWRLHPVEVGGNLVDELIDAPDVPVVGGAVAQRDAWQAGPDPDDAAGTPNNGGGLLGARLLQSDSSGTVLPEWVRNGSGNPINSSDLPPSLEAVAQVLPESAADAVSSFGAAVAIASNNGASSFLRSLDEPVTVEFDISALPVPAGSDLRDRVTVVLHDNCVVLAGGPRCESFTELPVDVAFGDAVVRATIDPESVAGRLAALRKPLPADIAAAADPFPITANGELREVTPVPVAALNGRQLQGENDGLNMLAITTGVSGPSGDYSATPAAPNATYQVGQFTGSVDLGYPIQVPAPASGAAPAVALAYSSGGIDSFISGRNNQAGPIGIGWSLAVGGSIRRSVERCSGNPYLCFAEDDSYSINLNGYGSKLVRDTDETSDLRVRRPDGSIEVETDVTYYRLEQDPMWLVARVTPQAPPAGSTTVDGVYWIVKTPDGTQHRFGGQTFEGEDLNSVQWAPMLDCPNGEAGCADQCPPTPGEPCAKAYQWNLDLVTDTTDNTTVYRYEHEIDRFRYAVDPENAPAIDEDLDFVRASRLIDITYPHHPNRAQPNARVVFNWENRCGSYAAGSVGDGCIWDVGDDRSGFIDTPTDLFCASTVSPCEHLPVRFWSSKRLGSIQTQVIHDGAGHWATLATHDLLSDVITPPVDPGGTQSLAKTVLRGIRQRPGTDHGSDGYTHYGFAQLEAELDTDRSPFTTDDQGGGTKVRVTQDRNLNLDRTWLGSAAGNGRATALAIRYASNGAAQVQLRLNGALADTINLPSTGGDDDFETYVIDLAEVGGIRDVQLRTTSAPVSGVFYNWIRFHADSYRDIPGLPSVRYDVADTADVELFSRSGFWGGNVVPVDTPDGIAELHDGFVFLNNRVYDEEAGRPSLRLPRVGRMINENGGEVTFTYGQSWTCENIPSADFPNGQWNRNQRDCFPAFLVPDDDPQNAAFVVFNKWKVMRVGVRSVDNDGDRITNNTYNSTRYEYGRVEWAPSDALSGAYADFRGHNVTTAHELAPDGSTASSVETYFFQGMRGTPDENGNHPNVARGSDNVSAGSDWEWFKGVAHEVRVLDEEGEWRSRERMSPSGRRYLGRTTAADGDDIARFIGSQRTDSDSRDPNTVTGDGTGWSTVSSRVDTFYAASRENQVSTVRDFGDLSTDADDRRTVISHLQNKADWLLTTVCQVRLSTGAINGGTILSRNMYRFDGSNRQCSGTLPSRGLVTRDRAFHSGSSNNTIYTYDEFGRVERVQAPEGGRVTTVYDDTHGVPTTSTNPVGDSVNYGLDDLGRVVLVTDPNDHQTTVRYDEYSRITELTEDAHIPGAVPTSKFTYSVDERPAWVKTDVLFDDEAAPEYLTSVAYYDGFGRVVQESAAGDQAGQMYVVDRGFNSRGLLVSETTPFQSSAGGGALESNFVNFDLANVPNYVLHEFDEVARPVRTTTMAGNDVVRATTTAFENLHARSVDANGVAGIGPSNIVTGRSDIRGNLVSVTDTTGTTTYEYDRAVYDQQFSYDAMDRIQTIEDRTAGGAWQLSSEYLYDTNGQQGEAYLSRHFDEDRGQIVMETMGWDSRGRPVATRMTSLDPAGTTEAVFSMSSEFGAGGQRLSQRLPGDANGGLGETLTYTYNSRTGRPTGMIGSEVGELASDITFSAIGQLLSLNQQGGVERAYDYDPGSLLMTSMQAGTDGANILNLDFDHDHNGNVTSIIDHTNGGQESCFGYDNAQRLVAASTSGYTGCGTPGELVGVGGYEHAYDYDARGNFLFYGREDRPYTYAPGTHQVVNIANGHDPELADWTFTYDPAGNLETRVVDGHNQTFIYDSQQRVVQITDTGDTPGTTTMRYAADGSRAVRETPDETTYYAFGSYEWEIASDGTTTARTNYSIAGELVAIREESGATDELTLAFSDHQGSASAFLNTATGETGTTRYYPFGHKRVVSDPGVNPSDFGFNGQIEDTSTGVMFFGARYYDQNVGRFLAADPMIPDPRNPADWNPYTFVRNSPVNFGDPTGNEPEYAQYPQTNADGFSLADFGGGALDAARDALGFWDLAKTVASCIDFSCDEIDQTVDMVQSAIQQIQDGEWRELVTEIAVGMIPEGCFERGRDYCLGYVLTTVVITVATGAGAARLAQRVDNFLDSRPNTPERNSTDRDRRVSREPTDWGEMCHLSFHGDTEVLMADGTSKPIRDVAVGDQVIATDPETGETSIETVEALWPHDDWLVEVHTSAGVIVMTQDHHVWNATDESWQEIQHFDRGDELLARGNSGTVAVSHIDQTKWQWATALDLTISNVHTYFVLIGDDHVLVHNNNGCGEQPRDSAGRFTSPEGENTARPGSTAERDALDEFETMGFNVLRGDVHVNVNGTRRVYDGAIQQPGATSWTGVETKASASASYPHRQRTADAWLSAPGNLAQGVGANAQRVFSDVILVRGGPR